MSGLQVRPLLARTLCEDSGCATNRDQEVPMRYWLVLVLSLAACGEVRAPGDSSRDDAGQLGDGGSPDAGPMNWSGTYYEPIRYADLPCVDGGMLHWTVWNTPEIDVRQTDGGTAELGRDGTWNFLAALDEDGAMDLPTFYEIGGIALVSLTGRFIAGPPRQFEGTYSVSGPSNSMRCSGTVPTHWSETPPDGGP
jgi:hypothetical protein